MQEDNLKQKVYYEVSGLNFKKFLENIKKNNIQVYNFKRSDYNLFTIGVNKQDEKNIY